MKLIGKILTVIDYVAMTIGFIAAFMIAVCFFFYGILGVFKQIKFMWSNQDDRIICIIVLTGFAWCALRWKKLNSSN